MATLSLSSELIYLIIGAIVGLILGLNLSSLFARFFRAKSSKERQLAQEVRTLQHKLKAKDDLIRKAVQAAKTEAKS